MGQWAPNTATLQPMPTETTPNYLIVR
uniref:Uncharacterized protein n=1 Tax=Rhizophora mucronata TaxID=61149 RepID=A0A2P2QXP4_RHIMU